MIPHTQGFLKLGPFQESEEIFLHAGLRSQEGRKGKYTAVAKRYLPRILVLWVRNQNPVTVTIGWEGTQKETTVPLQKVETNIERYLGGY